MVSTFFSLHYHIVFSTKEQRPFIKPEWPPRLHVNLGGIIKGMNGVPEMVRTSQRGGYLSNLTISI